MTSRAKRGFLFAAALLLLGSLLFPGVRDYLREEVVAPLLYLLWVAYLLLSSVPQVIYWAILALAVAVIASRQLSRPRAATIKRRAARQVAPPARLAEWTGLLEQAPGSGYDRWLLAQRLARLSAEVLAQVHRLPTGEVRRALAAGSLDLPPRLEAYVAHGLSRHEPWAEKRAFWKRPFRARTTLPTSEIEALVTYLETQLEGRSYVQDG